MDDQTFTLLTDRLHAIECRLCEVNDKIDEVLSFKWRLMGMASVVGFFGALAMEIVLRVF